MRRFFAAMMLLIFALAVACGNTGTTTTTEGNTQPTVKPATQVPHNIPYY